VSARGGLRLLCRSPSVSAVPSAPEKHTVLYDDECPLCTFQMRVLTWLDWRHALRLVPLSDPLAHEIAPGIEREDLLEAIHCVTRGGRIHRGARCIRFVGMRLPMLVPVALFLWVPGVIFIAERVYRWISRNRHLLGRLFGCKEACAILPARRREGDRVVS
jgi:predicted DCC family thiol-disulfide oxidoreductase YuxK